MEQQQKLLSQGEALLEDENQENLQTQELLTLSGSLELPDSSTVSLVTVDNLIHGNSHNDVNFDKNDLLDTDGFLVNQSEPVTPARNTTEVEFVVHAVLIFCLCILCLRILNVPFQNKANNKVSSPL